MYEMFTNRGNVAVDKMINEMKSLTIVTSKHDLIDFLRVGMKKIEKKHGEVYDTAVRECIADKVEKLTGHNISIFDI